jgi:hypothetical protein
MKYTKSELFKLWKLAVKAGDMPLAAKLAKQHDEMEG